MIVCAASSLWQRIDSQQGFKDAGQLTLATTAKLSGRRYKEIIIKKEHFCEGK
jgi:hypothetical protein